MKKPYIRIQSLSVRSHVVAYGKDGKPIRQADGSISLFKGGSSGVRKRAEAYALEHGLPLFDRWCCWSCLQHSEGYMVEDAVWEAAGMGKNGNLCLPCLQEKLGRPLVQGDFTRAFINNHIHFIFDLTKKSQV